MVLTSSSSTASTTSMFSMSTPSSAAAQTRVASLSLLSISTVLVLSTPRVLGTGPALTGLARRRGAPLIAPPATLPLNPLNPLMVFTSSSFSGDGSWHSCLSRTPRLRQPWTSRFAKKLGHNFLSTSPKNTVFLHGILPLSGAPLGRPRGIKLFQREIFSRN